MNTQEALAYGEKLAKTLGVSLPENKNHFGNYARELAYAVNQQSYRWRDARRDTLPAWAEKWRALYDTYEEELARDPMLAYRPQHSVAHAFHSSPAFIRYFRAGNRTSKTQSGMAEQYFCLTGQHPYRHMKAGNSFIVGMAFSKYAPNVFEKKFISGEEDNPLSPMFPDGGKWFNHYDERKHILTVACAHCAEAGKAKQCTHQKWSVTLYSDEGSWEVLQGAQFRLGHFDEHVREEFFAEAAQRLSVTARGGSSLIITGTPLFGFGAWENKLAAQAQGDPSLNLRDPQDSSSPPYISLHEISQFDAGIVPHDVIRMNMQSLSEFEIEARIYGRPAPLSKNPVFDLKQLSDYRRRCSTPTPYSLSASVPLEELRSASEIVSTPLGALPPDGWTGLRVWELPQPGLQYITAVDSAKGLVTGDASCCSVLKLSNVGSKLQLSLVAQYHGWLNTFDYGDEVFKLSVLFNDALCVVETTGGFGEAVLLRLKQLGYWNIFRDSSQERVQAGLEPKFGVETNISTKPFMVAALQQFVRDNAIVIPCIDTLTEMVSFEQQRTSKSGDLLVAPKFQGSGGAHDDRVMSLVIAAGVAVSYPIFDYTTDLSRVDMERKANTSQMWKDIHAELKRDQDVDPGDYFGGIGW